jgi:Tfp pilus assembly protein PilO
MKPKLILIGVGAAIVITGAWFMLLWSPQGDHLKTAKADKVAAEQRASVLTARLTHLKRLDANKDVLERDKAKFLTAMPDADMLDRFILAVNAEATKAGVSFVSISPQAPNAAGAAPAAANPGAPIAIGLQIQANGDYFALLRFMEQLRDGERLVTVENFNLSKGAGNEMTASIGGRMFMNNPAAAAAAPAATPSGNT